MQIQEIEIINTLETLSSVNVMLHFHRTQEQPSENAIMNYESRRQDLLEQLNELLASYEVILYARPQSAA